jgi:hypothetical protein
MRDSDDGFFPGWFRLLPLAAPPARFDAPAAAVSKDGFSADANAGVLLTEL